MMKRKILETPTEGLACPACCSTLEFSEGELVCRQDHKFPGVGSTFDLRSDALLDPEKNFQCSVYNDSATTTEFYADEKVFIAEMARQLAYTAWGINYGNLKSLQEQILLDKLDLQSGQRVLDIGCGAGKLLSVLQTLYGISGTGVDIAPLAIQRALQWNPCSNRYFLADAEALPFANSYFDAVVSFDVLEHLPHPQVCLREIARVLKHGGKFLVYAISRKNSWTWHWLERKLTCGRLGVDQIGGHKYENFLVPHEAIAWAESSSLKVEESVYFHALFTLIADEQFVEQVVPLSASKYRRQLLTLLKFADSPLTTRGHSNGFFLRGVRA